MSAVEKNTWPADQEDAATHPEPTAEEPKPTATKPALVAPPARPVRPAPPPKSVTPASVVPAAASTAPAAVAVPEPVVDSAPTVIFPLRPPSEPMQYRAIGMVRGTYVPTEADQINRGNLTTEDGVVVDSVLLGRVTSLVKKHLDLTASHLWVVYPRTRRDIEAGDEQDLHFQIVGVWEPETLGLPGEAPKTGPLAQTTDDGETDAVVTDAVVAEADQQPQDEPPKARKTKRTQAAQEDPLEVGPSPQTSAPADPDVDDNYFSIRGEVVKHEPEEALITVKILQGIKQTPGGAKSFKLCLKGHIEGRTVGYFWDFQVKRDAKVLTVETASVVGIVPPKKRAKGSGSGNRRPPGKRPGGPRAAALPRKAAGVHGAPRPKKVVGLDQAASTSESPE